MLTVLNFFVYCLGLPALRTRSWRLLLSLLILGYARPVWSGLVLNGMLTAPLPTPIFATTLLILRLL